MISEYKTNQSLVPGTVINSGSTKYIIKEVLAAGTFGITYLATGQIRIGNVSFDVPFAIKEHFISSYYRGKDGINVLCSQSSQNEAELSRKDFLTEAKRFQQLCNQTKFIVKVNEAFEANGTAYYVMEYLSGGTIFATSKQQTIDFMLNLSEAVKVLHDNRILHMDIKPSNIILKVDDKSNEPYPVLIDFGITKHFDIYGEPTTTPKAKGVSTGYAPVEQYENVTTFAPTIDIYAMGATLFYMLTKNNPPSAFILCDNFNLIQDSLKSAGCEDFIPFVTKAMAPNFKNRFQNIDDFREALRCVRLEHDGSVTGISMEAGCSLTEPIVSLNNAKDAYYGDLNSEHSHTAPVYKHIYTYKGSIESIHNLSIKNLLQSIIVAQDSSSKMFGIIDDHYNVIIPFRYYAIGCFKETREIKKIGFDFGQQQFVAPFFKSGNEQPNQGQFVLTEEGKIIETYTNKQTFFPAELGTRAIIHKQTFNVYGNKITIFIQQIPWGHYGITDSLDNVLVPFIYDSIELFSKQCTLPGPGIPPMFLGAKYTIGKHVGYFRILDNGILIDYQRYSCEKYRELSILT